MTMFRGEGAGVEWEVLRRCCASCVSDVVLPPRPDTVLGSVGEGVRWKPPPTAHVTSRSSELEGSL